MRRGSTGRRKGAVWCTSVPKLDAVLSYHLNPFTCGVAKFNLALAKRLGVPCLPLHTTDHHAGHVLVSVKTSEIQIPSQWQAELPTRGTFDLLLHDRPADIPTSARRVLYADESGCPSTIEGNAHRGHLNVLLFGMAHKIHVHTTYVTRLRDLLQTAHADYTVSVSTGVHEQQPWDEMFTKTIAALRKVFGDHLRVLGYLADDALVRELRDCTAVALFFDPAARANNTTIWGALEAGCPVVTNLDRQSPPDFDHQRTVFDLCRMTEWPFAHVLREVGAAGHWLSQAHGWDHLLEVLRA